MRTNELARASDRVRVIILVFARKEKCLRASLRRGGAAALLVRRCLHRRRPPPPPPNGGGGQRTRVHKDVQNHASTPSWTRPRTEGKQAELAPAPRTQPPEMATHSARGRFGSQVA